MALVDNWIRDQSQRIAADLQSAAQELFDSVTGLRRRKLDNAASAGGADEYENHMQTASDALDLIAALIEKGLPSVGNEFFRTPHNFEALLTMVETWLHFRKNPSDQRARSREREVLLSFAKVVNESTTFLSVLRPWAERRVGIGEQSKLFDDLIQEIAREIEPHVADRILARLSEKGAAARMRDQSGFLPEKWVLFNKDSPLWRNNRRKQFMALLNRASSAVSVHENALELIDIIGDGLTEGIGIPYGTEKLRTLIEDRDISGSLWKAATARPVQYRSLSRVKGIREQFAEICGTDEHLPIPGWMEAWASESSKPPEQ